MSFVSCTAPSALRGVAMTLRSMLHVFLSSLFSCCVTLPSTAVACHSSHNNNLYDVVRLTRRRRRRRRRHGPIFSQLGIVVVAPVYIFYWHLVVAAIFSLSIVSFSLPCHSLSVCLRCCCYWHCIYGCQIIATQHNNLLLLLLLLTLTIAQRIVKMKEEEEGFILNFPLEQQQQTTNTNLRLEADHPRRYGVCVPSRSRPLPIPFPNDWHFRLNDNSRIACSRLLFNLLLLLTVAAVLLLALAHFQQQQQQQGLKALALFSLPTPTDYRDCLFGVCCCCVRDLCVRRGWMTLALRYIYDSVESYVQLFTRTHILSDQKLLLK